MIYGYYDNINVYNSCLMIRRHYMYQYGCYESNTVNAANSHGQTVSLNIEYDFKLPLYTNDLKQTI